MEEVHGIPATARFRFVGIALPASAMVTIVCLLVLTDRVPSD